MGDGDEAGRWQRHMRRGELAEAWKIADAILASDETWRKLPPERHLRPVWRGEPIAGKRVLVRCHHGLGDTIQFVRYMPRLGSVAAEVVLAAQEPLLPILRSVPGVDRLIELDQAGRESGYEVDVEITELPHVFRDTLVTIPREVPYLCSSPPVILRDRLLVGLVHRAGDWDPRRSLPAELLPLLCDIPGVRVVDLQPAGRRIFIPSGMGLEAGEGDLTEVARLLGALDLVISVDTMAAHLTGAMARRVWTLLHSEADWRWLERRSDSPWYPTMRLYRQQTAGEWRPVLERLREDLRAEAARIAPRLDSRSDMGVNEADRHRSLTDGRRNTLH